MQINSFNHFRAIAILFIIAGHSFIPVGMVFDNLFEVSLNNLIVGGTSLFVFISGFLFHHIFYPKYMYKKFLGNKYYNVFVPYIILGFAPVLLSVLMKKESFNGYYLPNGSGMINEYLVPTFKYYMSGGFLNAYWYIPFIMITFIISPLHMKYIKIRLSFQLLIIVLLSIISIFLHRPVYNINVAQSVLYFTPVYLIGITASIYKEKIYEYLNGKELYLLVIAISLAVLQSYLGITSNYHKLAFEYDGIDIMYFQKISLCFFFMIWLNRFEKYNNRAIHILASTSFTAFFIHPFILKFLDKIELEFIKVDSWIVFTAFVGTLSLTCILIAKLIKKILPKYSKYLIGY